MDGSIQSILGIRSAPRAGVEPKRVEREVSSKIFVVLEIIFQDAAQSVFIENNDVIQVFAAKGTDQPLDIGVLPRAAWRSKNFVNAHPLGGLRRLVPVYSIAVTEQIPWGSIPREGFEKLRRSPFLSGKGSDGEMKRTSAIMVEDQEDEEDLEGHRWDEEEVYGDEVLGMVLRKARQVCEGGLRCRSMYLATVA